MRFWILNVFVRPDSEGAISPRSGNPLAVVECAPGALHTEQMQAIAFQFGYSETTFVSPGPEHGAWATRIFTPREELPFAGHPTLGTAHVVRSVLTTMEDGVTLRLPVGDVPVHPDADGRLWLRSPALGGATRRDATAVADDWGFDEALVDPAFAVVDYDAGPKPTLAPLRSVEAVAGFAPPASGPGLLYVFARDPDQSGVRARLFAPGHGIAEDPATGSAACCLGGYLLDHDYLGQASAVRVDVHQGEEMGRPSLLSLRARRTDDGDRIEVGGLIAEFARGELSSP